MDFVLDEFEMSVPCSLDFHRVFAACSSDIRWIFWRALIGVMIFDILSSDIRHICGFRSMFAGLPLDIGCMLIGCSLDLLLDSHWIDDVRCPFVGCSLHFRVPFDLRWTFVRSSLHVRWAFVFFSLLSHWIDDDRHPLVGRPFHLRVPFDVRGISVGCSLPACWIFVWISVGFSLD